jgi:trimethylamine--corrinoid protein Co-methyltransferase
MAVLRVNLLSEAELAAIHDASLAMLRDTGVLVHHSGVLRLLAENCVAHSGKGYTLYGRDPARAAGFGRGELHQLSSPGQFGWIDGATGRLRSATLDDARRAIRLGDALPNITIVGSMAQPAEISEKYREVALSAELVKGSTKPTRTWIYNGRTARYVLEIYRAVAGGQAALAARPMTEAFLEPISPLSLPHDGLEMMIELVGAAQPVSIGPMAMTTGTAPGTLAGTLAQENAEILSGVVVAQLLRPGTPILYGGIPHVLDPRTSICSFGSPEQALLAVAAAQLGRSYGFPVYVNVGLTDSKTLDAQAGMEKAATLVLGALAGAELFGHAGICGTDHGASLEWLVADDELMGYVKRIVGGMAIDPERLATEAVRSVGPGGSFLAEEHTVAHFRQELWRPGPVWTRDPWATWESRGRSTMADRAGGRVRELLATHQPPPLDAGLAAELDRIVESARRELG